MTYEVEFGQKEDFFEFKKLQSTILPDVQPIDQEKFIKLITKNEILTCKLNKDVLTGFAVLQNDGDIGYLRQLAILPKYRGKGLATLLVKAAHKWFIDHRLKKVKVFVKSKNEPALGLYKKFGYKIQKKLYQYIVKWSDFPENKKLSELRNLKPEEDILAIQKYNLHPSLLKNYREHKSSLNLGIVNTEIKGFMRLRPNFPVLTPIYLDDPKMILPVLYTIKEKFANLEYDHLRVTKEMEAGDYYYTLFKNSKWAKLNFILFRMEVDLKV